MIHEYARGKFADCAKVRTKKGVSLHDTRMGRSLEFPGIVEFLDTITRGKKMQENANKKREPELSRKVAQKRVYKHDICAGASGHSEHPKRSLAR